jgi:hypothetical protein
VILPHLCYLVVLLLLMIGKANTNAITTSKKRMALG